jgi:tetratricopeptide (TPR) repeat protein
MVAVADRYALFMTLGLALAAALAAGRIRSPRVRATAIAAVAVLAAARTYDARSLWASPIRLWERAAESDPRSGLAWSMYAEALASAGRADLAREAVATGLVWAPTPRLRLRDALLRLEAGDRAGGLAAMRQAAEAGEPRAMANLAVAELEAGRRDAARSWARRGAAAAPRLAHTRRVAGRVALETGQLAEAHAELSAALRLERSAANLVNLATVLVALDRPAAALPYLAEVAGAPGAEPALRARARAVHAEATRRLQRGPTPGPGPAVR